MWIAREIRNEKTILMFAVTDETDTITVKMFAQNEQLPDLLGDIEERSISENQRRDYYPLTGLTGN